MIKEEKKLFSMIDKRVSLKEKSDQLMSSVITEKVNFSFEILESSMKMDDQIKVLDKKIDNKMKRMGLSDKLWEK